jgi:protein SCO1/2
VDRLDAGRPPDAGKEFRMKIPLRFAMAALLGLLAGCGWKSPPLPSYNAIPAFTLTAQTGAEFDSREALAGKVWVADFIFTNCQGPCPRMSAYMQRIQDRVKDLPNVRLVSFTVDPDRDTPEVLAEYGRRFNADPERWYFLTGPKDTLQKLNRDAFLLGDINPSLEHSTRFVLVDREGVVRGYYSTSDPQEIDKLVADLRALASAS